MKRERHAAHLKTPPHHRRVRRILGDIRTHTPFRFMAMLLLGLWLLFALALFLLEQAAPVPTLNTYGDALYWGVAAFSTAGIADTPSSGWARLVGGLWIVVGSMLFLGPSLLR